MFDNDKMKLLYKRMVVTRQLEYGIREQHKAGKVRGPVHMCVGQEATGVGACACLNDDDWVTSTHRGHAHFVGKGLDLNKMVAEMMGKSTGYCGGKASHMLIASREKGMLGGCGIVCGALGIGVGYGLTFKMDGSDRVALSFLGDGASNEGMFHEALNMAALWKTNNVIFVEHNMYGLTVRADRHLSVENISDRAAAYGIPGVSIVVLCNPDFQLFFCLLKEVVRNSDVVFFSIKPNVLFAVLDEIKPVCREDQLFISHVAGHPISAMEARLPEKAHLIRIMPNTPALVNAGMTGVSLNAYVTEDESRMAMELFDAFGKDVVTGCSGSGPAYVFLFIEAMADAAVLDGMPRTQAYTFAAQTVLGSAKMVLETGRHPGELKDMVCSPGGTTIEAVAELEAAGLRNAVIKAEHVCTEKSKALGK